MLRKHNKLVILLVLATFMFSIVGAAGAATFSDVSGTSAQSSAIYKLSGLGIIDGYPDGTFGPEKTITRAEFAKIAVYTAGLQAVASGMQAVPSTFTDVAADHWANGWINVAAAQGFVKGYPNGTFAPQAQVTQAEAITVLLRILGYNDNLGGVWPSNYIAKAANLGVLDDVTFVANAAATRGTVATIGAAVLDENVVVYKASDNVFEEATKANAAGVKVAYTLLADKFKDAASTTEILVKEVVKTDGIYTMTLDKNSFEIAPVPFVDQEVELADNCVVSGVANKLSLVGKFVDYTVNDDGKATYVGIKDFPVVVTTKLEITETQSKVKTKEGKTYSFDTWANVYVRNINVGPNATSNDAALAAGTVGTYEYAQMYILTLNKDGKVAMMAASSLPQGGIVDSVGTEKIFFKDNASPLVTNGVVSQGTAINFVGTSNFTDKDIIVQKDGKEVALSDLEEGDAVWVFGNAGLPGGLAGVDGLFGTADDVGPAISGSGALGADYMIMASSNTVTAKLSTVELSGTSVSKLITDKGDYKTVGGGALLSVDGGDKYESTTLTDTLVNKYDLFDTDVTLLLGATGRVAAVISNASASDSNIYGMVTDMATSDVYVSNKSARLITVLRADGEEYEYPLYADTKLNGSDVGTNAAKLAAITAVSANALVEIELNSDGLIKTLNTTGLNTTSAVTVNTDLNAIKLTSTGKYYTANDVVVFNVNTPGTPNVVKWTEYKDAPAALAGYYVDGTAIEYAVIDAAVGSSNKYAVVMGKGINSDGDYVDLLNADGTTRYEVAAGTATAKGTIAEYTLSGGKATINVFVPAAAVDVTKIDIPNNIIEINSVGYLFDEDTLFFDTYDTDAPKAITASDIARGEKVSFKVDAANVLLYVTIVK